MSYQQLHDDPDAAIAEIVDRFHAVADQCDAVVIVGSDYTDVASPSELSVNARIAVNLGAPVCWRCARRGRTPDEVAQVVELCLAELAAQHAHTAAVVANRCDPAQLDAVAAALRRFDARRPMCCPRSRCWSRRRWPSCATPCDGTLINGDEELLGREAMGVLVAGMTAEHVLERLERGMAVITPGDRSDVVLAVASAHAAEGFPSLSLHHPQRRAAAAPVDRRRWWPGWGCGCRSSPPTLGTFETASAVAVGPGPGDGDLAAQDRHRAGADGAATSISRICWRSLRFRSRR